MSKYIVLFAAAFIYLLITILMIKFGWTLFAVPVFNLPELTLSQALGLSILVNIATRNSLSLGDKE